MSTRAQSRFPTLEVNETFSVTVDETEKGIVAKLNNNKTVFLKKWRRTLSFIETYDVNNDGHMDLVLNSEEHQSNHALIFLFEPKSSSYRELSYPGHEFSNLIITEQEPGIIISYINGQEWLKFGFNKQSELYRSGDSRVLSDHQLAIYLYQIRMYNLDGSIKSTKLETFEGANIPLLEVQVARLRLYDEPGYHAGSNIYFEKGAFLEVTAFEAKEWLKIKYKYAKETLERWVNVSELKMDISTLQYVEDNKGLNLVMIDPRNGDNNFYFCIALNNYSSKVFESYYGKIYILLENENGNKLLYPLYNTGDLKLPPQNPKDTHANKADGKWFKPGAVIDDNMVQWDAEKKQFVIFHDKSENDNVDEYPYVPFLPDGLSAGKYKISAVFMDSESQQKPLVSNRQELKFPLKKVSIDKK
ncbi:MAG: hypothetical protein EOO20_06145 [Chryseobacterium sp.]|nr:MAG: hypothetical protein EOO20_06145 [Chryseobacterium sp.]